MAALLAITTIQAGAVGGKKRVKYVPPAGFAGHNFGDLRSTFSRLPEQPLGVGASFMTAIEGETYFHCVRDATGGCDLQMSLDTLWRQQSGGGFYVLSEYVIEDQAFRYGDEPRGVVLYPVIYQFCANWDGSSRKRDVPPDFDAINKFCGVKLRFRSQSREELRKLPADHITAYDRMLALLMERFGEPDGFLRRGVVTIETLEGESRDAANRKFRIYRWCPAFDRRARPPCDASVVLSIEPATGVGTVLYSTPTLWEFAYARENVPGSKGDPLFRLLHARK